MIPSRINHKQKVNSIFALKSTSDYQKLQVISTMKCLYGTYTSDR